MTLGSLGGAIWGKIWPSLFIIFSASLLILRDAKNLNLFALGEADLALRLRYSQTQKKNGRSTRYGDGRRSFSFWYYRFIGLVSPHLIRLMVGTDHRLVLPGSALLGITLILTSDILARTAAAPAELPLGIITSLIGAPFFIWLLIRQRGWSS